MAKVAINEIPNEVSARGFKKILVTGTPDLIKLGVSKKVTDLLDANKIAYEVFIKI